MEHPLHKDVQYERDKEVSQQLRLIANLEIQCAHKLPHFSHLFVSQCQWFYGYLHQTCIALHCLPTNKLKLWPKRIVPCLAHIKPQRGLEFTSPFYSNLNFSSFLCIICLHVILTKGMNYYICHFFTLHVFVHKMRRVPYSTLFFYRKKKL